MPLTPANPFANGTLPVGWIVAVHAVGVVEQARPLSEK